MTRWPNFARQLTRHPAALVVAVFALSCLGDSSGPDVARPGSFQLAPYFETSAPSGLVPLDRVRILLFRHNTTTIALDTTAQIAPTDTALDLNLTVAVFTSADTFTARLSLITPSGDTAFSGGPLTVVGRPSIGGTTPTGPPVSVPLAYVGTGAGADSLVITVQPAAVITGDTVQFQAVAYDNGLVVPGTPVGWTTLDPVRASIPQVTGGKVVGGNERGAARIVARTLTGQADTATVTVNLAAATISPFAGNNQSAIVRTLLGAPLVAQIVASDGLPVPGAWIKFAVQSGGGSVSADSAFTDVNGRASVQWTLGPIGGAQQIKAAPARGASVQTLFTATGLAGASGGILVSAGDGQTATVGTAVATVPAVLVQDPDGNPVPNATVNFAVVSGGGGVTGATQITDGSGIARVGSWTLGTTVGANSLSATVFTGGTVAPVDSAHRIPNDKSSTPKPSAGSAAFTTAGANFIVIFTANGKAGAATALQVTGLAASVNAGSATTATVTLRDTYGNVASGYLGTIHFTSSDGSGTLPANYTFVAGDAGTHVFSLTFATIGSQSVTATDVGQGTISGNAGTTVNAVLAPSLAVTGLPASYIAGTKGTVVVTAKDGSGNTVTNYGGTVHFTSNDLYPLTTLPADYTFQPGDNGTHTFTSAVALHLAGSRTVTATDVGTPAINGNQAVTVVPTSAFVFLLTGVPNPADPNINYDLTVAVKDSFLNTATGYTGTIQVEVAPDGDASHPGNYQFTTSDAGQHAFSPGITFVASGLQGVLVTDVNDQNLVGAISTIVTGGPPADHLTFGSPPQNAAQNTVFPVPIVVAALDVNGALATGFTGAITIAISTNPGSGLLHGTTTVAAIGGYATFSDLYIDATGTGYTLQAAAAGLSSATSPAFDIGAGAQIIHWIGATGGNWSTVGNWDAGRLPLPTEVADISLAGSYTVTLDIPQALSGLTLGGAGSAPTLTAGALTITLSGAATIAPNATLALNGTTVEGSGTLNDQGLMQVRGDVEIDPAISTAAGSILRIEGSGTLGVATLTTAADLSNAGSLELTSNNGSASALHVNGGLLNNALGGSISSLVGSGGARTIDAGLNNFGTVTVNQPLALSPTISTAHSNSGTINIAGANLSVTLVGTGAIFGNGGTVNIGANRTWSVSGGLLELSGGVVNGPGIMAVNSSIIHFTPTTVLAPVSFTGVTIPSGVSIADGETLTVVGGSIDAPLSNSGLLVIHGSVGLNGILTTDSSSTIRVEGSSTQGSAILTVASGFANAGVIDLTSNNGSPSQLSVTTGTLTNDVGASINSLVGSGGARTLAAQLDNQGTVTISQALALLKASAAHGNSGTINLTGSNLTIDQTGTNPSFTNTGDVNVPTNRIFAIHNGAVNLVSPGGLVSGGGSLQVDGAAIQFSTANVTAQLNFSGNTIAGGLTIPQAATVTLIGGDLSDQIINNGQLIVRGNVQLLGPAITTGPGSFLRIEGSSTQGAAQLITNGFTNVATATINLTSNNGSPAQLTVNSGTLINETGATINSQVGSGGARTLALELDNRGSLVLNQPLTLGRADAHHTNTNTGTIDLTGANLTMSQTGTSTPSFTNTGTITVPLNRTWSVTGGSLTLSGGQVNGTGTLAVNSSAVAFTTASVHTLINFSNVVIPGGVTIPTTESLTLVGGNINDPITNNGTLTVRGIVALTGALNTGAGSTLQIEGSGAQGSAVLTVTSGFTNSAAIILTSTNGSPAQLAVTGTLVNTGSITSAVGSGGARVLSSQLDNSGSLLINQPLTLDRSDAAHINRSTIDLVNANLTVTQTGTAPSFTNTGTMTVALNRQLSVTGGTLNLTGGTLSGAGTLFTNGSTVNFTPSSVTTLVNLVASTVPGGVTIAGPETLTLVGGAINEQVTNNGGTLVTRGIVALNGPLTAGGGSTLRVEGSGTQGSAVLTVANGFTNSANILLTSTNGSPSELAVTAGTLVNTGTITSEVGSGGSRTLAAQLDNQGTMVLNQPLALDKAGAAHINRNTINLASANLTVNQTGGAPSFTNTGTINVALNRVLTVAGGTIDFSAGGSTVSGAGTLTASNATASFTTGTVQTLVNFTNVAIPGGINIPGNQTLTLTGGNIDDQITNNGTLIVRGTVSLNGPLATGPSPAQLRVEGSGTQGSAILTVANSFTNNAAILLTSTNGSPAQLTVTNGTLTNAIGATISSDVGSGGSRMLATHLVNQGTLTVNQPLTLTRASAAHSNSGTINLISADLAVTQSGTLPSFTNTGAINVALNRTLSVSGGTLDLSAPGIVSGAGTLSVSTAALSFSTASVTTLVSFSGVSIPAGVTVPSGQSLTIVGGAINETININSGGLVVARGIVAFNGPITNAGTLRVEGSGTQGSASLGVGGGFVNDGAIELTSNNGSPSSLTATGTLTNNVGGTITSIVGSGGARTIAAQLNNAGQLIINQPLTLSQNGAQHVNSGSLAVNNSFAVSQSGSSPSFTNIGTIAIAATRTMTVSGGGGTFVNANSPATGTIQGTGTLNVTGAAFTNAGIIEPGTPGTVGTLTINGDVTFQASSLIHVNVTSVSSYDVLAISGNAAADGEVRMEFTYLSLLQTFTPVTYLTRSGSFTVTGAGLLSGLLNALLNALGLLVST